MGGGGDSEGKREKIHREGRGKVWEQLKGKVGGDGNMCVGVFYTSARGRMEVSGRGMGARLIQSAHE